MFPTRVIRVIRGLYLCGAIGRRRIGESFSTADYADFHGSEKHPLTFLVPDLCLSHPRHSRNPRLISPRLGGYFFVDAISVGWFYSD